MYSVSGPVRECRQYADDCAGRAKALSDPVLRQELKDMQRRWLSLARSYEFTNDLIHQSKKRRGAHRRRAVLADP